MTLLRVATILLVLCVANIEGHSFKPWNELIFTQSWPASFCVQVQMQKKHTCSIPANVTTWNIHGIWPTENGGMGPSYCNKTDKFNPQKLQPIRDQLLKYWANLFKDETPESFWTHEWEKHGTCAEELGTLGSELKYFSAGLMLNRKIDLLKFLTQGGIVQSDATGYKLDDINNVLKTSLGVVPKLQCFVNEDKTRQYISQIEVCLNRQFEVIQCMKKPHRKNSWQSNNLKSKHQHLRRASTPAQNEPCTNRLPISYPTL